MDRSLYPERPYTFHAIHGFDTVAHHIFCENERHWRTLIGITPERFNRYKDHAFDECNNSWLLPNHPSDMTVLRHLHKYSDFE